MMTGKKTANCLAAAIAGLILAAGTSSAQDLESLFTQVEALKIQREGYVLGAPLTFAQQEIAAQNPLNSGSPKVFKFKDQDLNIVADKDSSRVLVLYERFEKISQSRVQEVMGDLFMTYEEPTVSAHDQVVYWAWGPTGKFTQAQFDMAKETQKKLVILATVKFNSEIKIMDKAQFQTLGDVYYIISSDPLLQFFHDN